MIKPLLCAITILAWAGCGGRAIPSEPGPDDVPTQEQEVLVDPLPNPPPTDPVVIPDEPPDVEDDVGYACDLASAPGTTDSLLLNPRSRSCRTGMCLHVRGVAHCTDFCTQDADCPASGPECTGGFVCTAPFVVGQPACCKMCVCASALLPSDLRFSEVSCAGRGCTLAPK